jgi:Na+/H+ antiporter NhaD/arsenite permease-like protein
MAILALSIFIVIFALIVSGLLDATVVSLTGAVLMILTGILTFEEAVASVQFETLTLLMSMMLLVEVAREAGIFSWLTVKITKLSRGNPLFLFLLLTLTTAVVSSFLDNVTTVVLMIPITIQLVKGMGRDPMLYVMGEIMFSNLGGAATLIGDSSNIIIGGASGLSFNTFLINLAPPVLVSVVLITLVMVATHWKKHLKPISSDLNQLFLTHILMRKIEYKFLQLSLNKSFMLKCGLAMLLTMLGFIFQHQLGLSVAIVALTGALLVLLIAAKEVDVHASLRSVEWSTLLFFVGLFIMVAGLEKAGLLEYLANFILNIGSGSYLTLLLVIVWVTGFISMLLNTVPFVTLMVPVIIQIQAQLPVGSDPNLLWWALSMGACFGGNATVIGASANVVGVGVARKEGLPISFFGFLKYGLPMTLISLSVASAYLTFRVLA